MIPIIKAHGCFSGGGTGIGVGVDVGVGVGVEITAITANTEKWLSGANMVLDSTSTMKGPLRYFQAFVTPS